MRIVRGLRQMASIAARAKRAGRRVGFVPTMGALHEGHASLIRAAAAENDLVVVSIFVNPLQFGPAEDFARYPRMLAQDCRLAAAAGADLVFAPSAREMCPPGCATTVDPGALGRCWEGKIRPGHFQGVATVVLMLFEAVQPSRAYFGQKDYQQSVIIRRLVRDLKLPVVLRVLPTVREPDGLAMSSRNRYLTPAQRARAAAVPEALLLAQSHLRAGERRASALMRAARRHLRAAGLRVDYAAVVDAETLRPVGRARGRVAVLLAVRLGTTRLIDNLLVVVS